MILKKKINYYVSMMYDDISLFFFVLCIYGV